MVVEVRAVVAEDHKVKWAQEKAVKWLVSILKNADSFKRSSMEITGIYKIPLALLVSGDLVYANRVLEFIKNTFFKTNGDFREPKKRREDPYMSEFRIYPNGWILVAAHKLGRFDISLKGFRYLLQYFHKKLGAWCTNNPYLEGDEEVDIITTAHLGLTSLFLGDIRKAMQAGDFLSKFITRQPKRYKMFYLRAKPGSVPITEFDVDTARFYAIDLSNKDQDYFHVGYPVAFLGKLFQASGKRFYLDAARRYMAITHRCQNDVYSSLKSGKIGWGAAIIYSITGDKQYLNIVNKVADYLVMKQTRHGYWWMDSIFKSPKDQPMYCTLDMTAENIIWLSEFSSTINVKSSIK